MTTLRPTVRCLRIEDIERCPVPGTILRLNNGETVLWAGVGPSAVNIPKVAGELRTARRVLVVARAPGSVRREIQTLWSAQAKTARAAETPPTAAKAEGPRPARCGQPAKNGTSCGQAAGWGTDTPGVGPCLHHGGPTVLKDADAHRRNENAHTVAEAARKARTGPLPHRKRLEGEIALLELLAARERRRRRR